MKCMRNSFANVLGYTVLSISVTSKEIVFIGQEKYENQAHEFCEKVWKEIESPGIKYGSWRLLNAFDMIYSGLPGSEDLDRLNRSEVVMSNKTVCSVFDDYLDQDICLARANNEGVIAGVARLNAWKHVTVVFMCDERDVKLGDRQRNRCKKVPRCADKTPPTCFAANSFKHTHCTVRVEGS